MDRFDDIWRNRFNQGNPPVDNWNTPDEDVWGAIIAEIPTKKESRRWWLFWLGLGLFITTCLAVFTYKDIVDNDSLEKQSTLNHFELQPEQSIPTASTILPSATSVEVEQVEGNTSIENKREIESEQIGAKQLNKKVKISNQEENPEAISRTKQAIVKEETTIVEQFTFSKLETSGRQQAKLSDDHLVRDAFGKIDLLSFLPLKIISPVSTTDLSSLLIPELKVVSERNQKLRFAFNTGASLWTHRISDQYTTDLSPFDFNYTDDFGWQAQLALNYSLNRHWAIKGGLQYEQIQSTSGHNSALSYDPNAEMGQASNDYALDLATPYGLSGAEFQFRRNEDIGEEEVALLVDFTSLHNIRNISLPITTQVHPWGMEKKWLPAFSVGVGINYLESISNKLQSIDTHHDAIQFDANQGVSFATPAIQKWHLDYRIGTSLSYRFSPLLHLNLGYDWVRGINPVFQQDNYKTTIDRHLFSLGLVKRMR